MSIPQPPRSSKNPMNPSDEGPGETGCSMMQNQISHPHRRLQAKLEAVTKAQEDLGVIQIHVQGTDVAFQSHGPAISHHKVVGQVEA